MILISICRIRTAGENRILLQSIHWLNHTHSTLTFDAHNYSQAVKKLRIVNRIESSCWMNLGRNSTHDPEGGA